jgi:hypothetical protein
VKAVAFGRRSNPNVEESGFDDEPILAAVEGQVGRSQSETDNFRLTWREFDLAVRFELADRASTCG